MEEIKKIQEIKLLSEGKSVDQMKKQLIVDIRPKETLRCIKK